MRQYSWELTTSALNDIEEAVDFYNKHSFGLGNKFLIELDNTIKKIARNPFAFSIKYDEVRWAALKRFPFLYISPLMKELN